MLFQNEFLFRLVSVSIIQIWPIFYSSYFAYKILKRARNRSTYTLSAYFITTAFTYFIATISIFLVNTPFSYIVYMISMYFFVFSHSFLINFSWLLINLDEKSSYNKLYLRICLYAIFSLYIIIFGVLFSGITLDASTGWIPNFSIFFFGISWAFFLIFLIFPQIYLSFKILKEYKGIVLKKRLARFLSSVFLMLYLAMGFFIFHAWSDNLIYKTIHTVLGLVLGISAAYLVYKGFGKDLE